MKGITLSSALRMLSLLLMVSTTCAFAEERGAAHFVGLINDYSPATVKGGPWEMHGEWSMDVNGYTGFADFSADMTMADYGSTMAGMVDPTQGGMNPHTHHIKLTKVSITWDMTGCPTYSPATTGGFQVSGTVSLVTGNGGPAPFETVPPSSTLQVCVTGAALVPYSNMSMMFGGPATTHFGSQAIHGVVHKVSLDAK